MDYTLAKELKDAGFPQKSAWMYDSAGVLIHCFDDKGCYCPRHAPWDDEYACVPTLTELIAACKGHSMRIWINPSQTKFGVQRELQSLDDVELYPTPEEAVARLYLALHPKKD